MRGVSTVFGVIVSLGALGGCASRRVPVETRIRARLDALTAALDSSKPTRIDPLVTTAAANRDDKLRERRAEQLAPELKQLATSLRDRQALEVRARIRVVGALGSEVRLDRDEDGWRVDPDTVTLEASTPRAAIEQLTVALERLESDPALALLTAELHSEIIRNARERAAGLRDLMVRLPVAEAARSSWPLDLEYGQGLFIRLRVDHGQWRVDDFN